MLMTKRENDAMQAIFLSLSNQHDFWMICYFFRILWRINCAVLRELVVPRFVFFHHPRSVRFLTVTIVNILIPLTISRCHNRTSNVTWLESVTCFSSSVFKTPTWSYCSGTLWKDVGCHLYSGFHDCWGVVWYMPVSTHSADITHLSLSELRT